MPHSLEHGFLNLPYTEMVWIEPDSFLFQEGKDETKQITFKKGFWASKYPVTQELYEKVMEETSYDKYPSRFKGKHRPVERVSWLGAQDFLKELNKKIKLTDGLTFHLPSEAMWEYVARANEKTEYSGSHVLSEVAWYSENSYGQTMPVGLKEPNGFELYDLSGNVWEWCADATEDWQKMPIDKTPSDGLPYLSDRHKDKILRGGSYYSDDYVCRVGDRVRYDGNARYNDIGFRVFRY